LGDEGEFLGFDVVIGNPPWGASLDEASSQYLKEINREIIVRMTDTFMYFVNLSFSIIHERSLVTMILPDVILYQIDNEKLRKKVLKFTHLDIAINLGDNIFTDVARRSCIIILSKLQKDISYMGEFLDRSVDNIKNFELSEFETKKLHSLPNTIFPTKNLGGYEILSKAGQRKLIDLIDDDGIQRGVSPDLKKAFIVIDEIVEEYKLEDEYLCPTITGGRDLIKYIVPEPTKRVIYTKKRDDPQKFKNIVKFINGFKDEITCKEVKQGKHPIWALHRGRKRQIFEKAKLVGVITSDSIQISFDKHTTYPTDGIYVFSANTEINNMFLLGFLNSRLITYLYRLLSMEKGRTLSQIKPKLLEQIPIPNILDSSAVSELSELSKKIYEKKDNDPEIDTSELEAEIDRLVYKLYGLSEEEIGIVEGSLN
ncbi:MAG: TaqI-like C-terminal specificity domain-containing protein, partial [Candidatus Paceibacterota bacterium]